MALKNEEARPRLPAPRLRPVEPRRQLRSGFLPNLGCLFSKAIVVYL